MEDQITDYSGKEIEGASEDLLRTQKISLYQKIWNRMEIPLNQISSVCVRWQFGRSYVGKGAIAVV